MCGVARNSKQGYVILLFSFFLSLWFIAFSVFCVFFFSFSSYFSYSTSSSYSPLPSLHSILILILLRLHLLHISIIIINATIPQQLLSFIHLYHPLPLIILFHLSSFFLSIVALPARHAKERAEFLFFIRLPSTAFNSGILSRVK